MKISLIVDDAQVLEMVSALRAADADSDLAAMLAEVLEWSRLAQDPDFVEFCGMGPLDDDIHDLTA